MSIVDASYNKQGLARLESTERRADNRADAFKWARTMVLILRDDSSPAANIKVGEWSDSAQLFGVSSCAHVLTSPALDLCTVDTLQIILPIKRVVISPDHRLRVTPARAGKTNRVLWQDSDGNAVVGKCAKWGNKKTKRGKQDTGVYVEIGSPRRGWIEGENIGCLIQFSVPGIIGKGDNSWPVDKILASGAIDMVQGFLADLGIHADLREAKVVRCDLNRNMVLDDEFKSYEPLYKALDLPRSKKEEFTNTGMQCTNKSHGTLFYDKIVKMKAMGLRRKHLPKNLGRWEWQVKHAVNVRKKLGIHTVQHLLDRWNDLPALFAAHTESLFRYNLAELQAPQPRLARRDQDAIQGQLFNLVRWCQKQGINHDLDLAALDSMVRQGEIAGYAEKIKQVPGMPRKHANDAISRMRKAFWREMAKDPDFVRRYEEVLSKIQGGKCWPVPSAAAQRELDKYSDRVLARPR